MFLTIEVWSMKDLLCGLKNRYFLGRKCYSRIVKIAYLANLFSQSQHMIGLFLPARVASHTITVVISSLRVLLLISVDKLVKNCRNLKSGCNSF